MTDDIGPLSHPPTAAEHVGESLTFMSETLAGLSVRIENGQRPDGESTMRVYMGLAQAHASLAVAAQLGRIADWLEGVQLIGADDEAEDEDDEDEPRRDVHAICALCGHPITCRAGSFWSHDDARRNGGTYAGGHKADPIPESIE